MIKKLLEEEVGRELDSHDGDYELDISIGRNYIAIEINATPNSEVPALAGKLEDIGELQEMEQPVYNVDIHQRKGSYAFTVEESAVSHPDIIHHNSSTL